MKEIRDNDFDVMTKTGKELTDWIERFYLAWCDRASYTLESEGERAYQQIKDTLVLFGKMHI